MDGRVFWISVILLLPLSSPSFDVSVLNGSESLSPSSSRTLVSRGEKFELGFFRSERNGGWYLGIWYKSIPVTERTYVWVANGDNPLENDNGTFQISGESLVICDGNSSVWKERITGGSGGEGLEAELLDNGNLLLRRNSSEHYLYGILWQSFDNPWDTLIPGMELGMYSYGEKELTSWSFNGPEYTLRGQSLGPPGLDIVNDVGLRVYRSGPWNGQTFTNLPKVFSLTSNSKNQTIYKYVGINSSYSRLRLLSNGSLAVYTWNNITARWETSWESTPEPCDAVDLCGSNAYCEMNGSCSCIQGFEAESCVRKDPLNCRANQFHQLANMSLPPHLYPLDFIKDIRACQDACVAHCQCTAFSFAYGLKLNSSSCLLWEGNLDDLRSYSHGGGLLLHIKQNERSKKKLNTGVIVGLSLGIPAAFLVSLAVYCYWKRSQQAPRTSEIQIEMAPPDSRNDTGVIVNPPIPPMDFGTILQATETFSHQIGHGGFGKVYKGRLLDGREIAVKRLSKTSRQGIVEFTSEVMLISRLQHINLVSLLGWSIHEEEMVLVYELLENGNLETHLFGRGQSSLNWETRFEIIKGIARGLSYLHEDSRVMAIHRDLKPSNILLDKDMIPKISDFGLARTENEANTKHAAGTHGYMAPEYAVSGRYSNKSDVFAFGVMVLEIVTGKKNSRFSYQGSNPNFLSFVWKNWRDNKWRESIEGSLLDSSQREDQVQRCLLIGLGCVQLVAADRPKMSLVVSQLENHSLEVPDPGTPGFYAEEARPTSSKHQGESSSSASVNWRTLTGISGR